jgi:hypothetical protein
LLLVGYSSLAQIKSFDDLRGIDSREAFIRVCLENGYEAGQLPADWKIPGEDYYHLYYGYGWDETVDYTVDGKMYSAYNDATYNHKDTISYSSEWTSPFDGQIFPADTFVYKKGEWEFFEKNLNTKRKNGNSYYDKILAEVKNECTLFDIALEEVLIYECPAEGWFTDGVKFKGKLGFRVAGDWGIIKHRLPD